MKKLLESLRAILGSGSRKKMIENAVIVVIIGIIIIIAGGSLLRRSDDKDKPDVQQQNNANEVSKIIKQEDQEELESRIEGILSQINGAGSVSVMITYVSGNEKVPAFDIKQNENDTQEKDSNGGTRSIRQHDSERSVVFEEGSGSKRPVIVKELQPEVKGVIVVAEGAADSVVKESLGRAVQVLLNVPLNRVQVFQRK